MLTLEAYGQDFSRIYNQKWDLWGRKMWPLFLKEISANGIESGIWLDLCCGPGTLLKMADTYGFKAVGVDRSPFQLQYARRKAPSVEFIEADVRDFSIAQRFDIVTCIFDSLNYILSLKDLARLIHNTRNHLNENGLFLFDIKTVYGFQTEKNKILNTPYETIIFESSYDKRLALHTFKVTGFVRKRKHYRKFEEHHVQKAFKQQEIETLLTREHFRFKKLDGETFSRAKAHSKRLLYVCRNNGKKN